MMAHRLRRWPIIKTTLAYVFAGRILYRPYYGSQKNTLLSLYILPTDGGYTCTWYTTCIESEHQTHRSMQAQRKISPY